MALVPKHWPARSLSWPRHQVEKTHRHSPHDLLPLLRRNVSGPRGPFLVVLSSMPRHLPPHDSVRTSSLGVPKDRPSAVQSALRPLQAQIPKEVHSRHEAAKPHTRAVLVVSHELDGLLRITPCRFVAPCCRLWGSPRFRVLPPGSPMQASVHTAGSTLPLWRRTLRSVPLDNSSCRVTATDSLSLFQLVCSLWADASADFQFLHGPANLRALLRCRVRCSRPTLPPARCPILPWASTIKAVVRQWRRPRSGLRRHPARTPEGARTDCRGSIGVSCSLPLLFRRSAASGGRRLRLRL